MDTSADVNIMPVSIYKLLFQGPDCEKLTPSSKLEIGIYTTNKIKVIGSCILFVVHPDTQCLQEVTFYITSHEGNVVLSCTTTLGLSLIQPHTSLDHLPKGASLVSSSAYHPIKNESQFNIHVLSRKSEVLTESNCESMGTKLNTSKNLISIMCSSKKQSLAVSKGVNFTYLSCRTVCQVSS